MKKIIFSLGMLLLTVAAYADGTILFSTAKGSIDVPPYRIPGITCGHSGRLVASAARLVCGTDPGYGRVDCVVKLSYDNGRTWSEHEIDVACGDASLINAHKTPM
ncbi:MAG: glycoside hydrolase, partial [Prevotella sp.]|nr:glycoside hydrolase [Prevotella sp.]